MDLKKHLIICFCGILIVTSSGCGTVSQYKTETAKRYGNPVREEISREKTSAEVAYHISEIKQDGYHLIIPVVESRKAMVKATDRISRDVFEETYNVTEYYDQSTATLGNLIFFPVILLGSSPFQPTLTGSSRVKAGERRLDTEVTTETKETTEDVYNGEPSKGVSVKVSSEYFGFGDGASNSVMTKTDPDGLVEVRITKVPYLWDMDEGKLKNNLISALKGGMRPDLIEKIDFDHLPVRILGKNYPINIQTISDASLIASPEENIKYKDDRSTFDLKGKEIDIAPVYSYIDNLIKTDLENQFKRRSFVIKAVGEDLISLTNVIVDFKAINTLTLEDLTREMERIKERYLVAGTDLYSRVFVDPSYLISSLDAKSEEIPLEGLEIFVNVPSEYEIRARKEGFDPIEGPEGRIKFTEQSGGVVELRMTSLGTKIRLGASGATRSVISIK